MVDLAEMIGDFPSMGIQARLFTTLFVLVTTPIAFPGRKRDGCLGRTIAANTGLA